MTRTDPPTGPQDQDRDGGPGAFDDLPAGLAGLAADAPATLLDRIAARRVHVPGPLTGPDEDDALSDLQVAYTDQGVAFVRAGLDEREFAAAFRERFARPLLPSDRLPAGLLPALRNGRLGGLRLDLRGLSPFEAAVLRATATIPRGQTRPYAWVARQAGNPKAVRAAGSALGRNPVPLLIPCHRVTRSDGTPGQYVFGAPAKERLLRAENVDLDGVADLARQGVFFIGSDTTGIVCYPTCVDARRITPAHRHGFRTVAAAEAAGYRPCEHCRPALPQSA
ncbi:MULTISPECIES: methylated-DNA--[protein]-cysteine S-methyltransferase [Actinomadura]|uniref:Methylated-DNA--[protein]-cysteine S-methyltransferase n=1 Tax=Actinomadura yumaensis TaxID=111807 RepID=A0ABW2CRK9_9ACTN|nr:methylated-DNA--[protein]-cysteine S-methyltransferase [Actinomadura sp. J1-007]MWK39775.1 methylated-DNA--[protein]-cysteine S-methyltransferase [Actinomadura sp. J1-007]